jgi:hypothetical protein
MTNDELAARIARAMQARGYAVDKGEGEINIVYVEGMNRDGTRNGNRRNAFDDLRIVITYRNGRPVIAGMWDATTQPGVRFTQHPVADARTLGAAIIDLGQQRCWQVGCHRGQYEALVQRNPAHPVTICRDKNMDYRRDGDRKTTGVYGINQHHGHDAPKSDIGGHSAGCLVTPKIADHAAFMRLVKSDPRHRANNRFVFATTVMPAAWVLDEPKPAAPKPISKKLTAFGALGAAVAAITASLAEHPVLATLVVLIILAALALGAALFWRKV